MKGKLKKRFITGIKILVSLSLIFWILSKLNWTEVGSMLNSANFFYFSIAVFCFLISQVFSIFRFNLFIRKIGIRIGFQENRNLYLLGMFYNFFLPGGIGGDAYKVYLLNKSFGKSLKKIGQMVFVDRFLGIVAIGFFLCLLLLWMHFPIPYFWNVLVFVLGLISVFVVLKLLSRWIFVHRNRIFKGFLFSVVVQFFQILCVYFLMKAFNIQGDSVIYAFMFLISSVLSIVSFAGLGIREAVFYFGALWFSVNPDFSASIALIFNLITAFFSLFGLIFLIYPIQFKNTNK